MFGFFPEQPRTLFCLSSLSSSAHKIESSQHTCSMLPPAALKNLVVRVALEEQKSWVHPMRFLMWQLVIRLQQKGIQVFMDRYNQWASSTLKVRSKLNDTSTAPCTPSHNSGGRGKKWESWISSRGEGFAFGRGSLLQSWKNLARELSCGCIRPEYVSHYSYFGIIIWHFFIIFP